MLLAFPALGTLLSDNVNWGTEDFALFGLMLAALFAEAGYDAVIVHACVIRGDTPHFDFVCAEAARGCTEAAMSTGVPVAFGVLTVENHQQAVDSIGGSS
jgi:6,7-dimethyl-8-ribityllumazine synthase